MIIQAKNTYGDGPIDVFIDVFDVMCQLSQDWRLSIGVDSNSPIMGGYWMKVAMSSSGEYVYDRIRLATRDEIVRFDAIKNLTEYTAETYL